MPDAGWLSGSLPGLEERGMHGIDCVSKPVYSLPKVYANASLELCKFINQTNYFNILYSVMLTANYIASYCYIEYQIKYHLEKNIYILILAEIHRN